MMTWLSLTEWASWLTYGPRSVDGGKREELRCETLLGLRKGPKGEPEPELGGVDDRVETTDDNKDSKVRHDAPNEGPPQSVGLGLPSGPFHIFNTP
jgi:hypothetical protein